MSTPDQRIQNPALAEELAHYVEANMRTDYIPVAPLMREGISPAELEDARNFAYTVLAEQKTTQFMNSTGSKNLG